MNVTPTRKSRRLSGSAPEEVDNTVVLPLKKRRASIGLAEENTRENEPTESEPTNDADVTTLESNLEVIDEKEEDEISPKKKNTTPAKTTSKTPENKSSKKTSASSRQTPKEPAKATPDKTPKKESEKSSKTPTKATTPNKTVASPKVGIEESSSDEYETAKESLASSVDDNDLTIQAEQACIKVEESEQEVFAEEKDIKQVEKIATEKVENIEKEVNKENKPLTEEEILRRLALSLVKTIPRQKCKSGRFWKSERAQFGSLKKDQGKKLDLDRKIKLKEEKERNRDEANALIIAKNKKKEEFRLKIEEAQKRKAENRRRAEVVQIVKNPNKIKKMKKKALVRRDILTK
jgi:rRNA-processing protein CGR1